MIYDLSECSELPDVCYDICIIGTGPAGITVAKELAGSDVKVCVLESGSFRPNGYATALRDLDWEGVRIKDYSRERIFGGTSTTWAGLSSPMDAIDFERRDWVKNSGWPFDYDHIIPYYQKASERYGFPAWNIFFKKDWMPLQGYQKIFNEWEHLQEKIFIATEPPQDFASLSRQIFNNHRVDLFVNATVTHMEGCAASQSVRVAMVRNPSRKSFAFRAETFVLATGGIENPRILLNSTFANKTGLGNEGDQVGRYFMNHPKNNYGVVRLKKSIKEMPGYFGFLSLHEAYAAYIGLRMKESLQKEKRLLNAYVRFEPIYRWSGRESVQALLYFARKSALSMRILTYFRRESIIPLRDYSETGDDSDFYNQRKSLAKTVRMAASILSDLPAAMSYTYNRLFRIDAPKLLAIHLRNFMEMEPIAENRVLLSDRKDAFGTPLPFVSHSPGDLDKKSIAAVQHFLNLELKRLKLGRLSQVLTHETEPWPVIIDASHHMGATRMGNDPATSVVDKNCKLHHVQNVYVAGASVFPTSGIANPTYTIVALAIRLADHIKANKNFVA